MKPKIASQILNVLILLTLSSCATQYHGGLEAVSPEPPTALGESSLNKVDSLQPTLSWKNDDASVTKFDLIIYTGIAKSTSRVILGMMDSGQDFYVPGVEVYYREGIEGCSHRVEKQLQPKTVYVWSVRTRSGTLVGPWSTYDFQRGGKAIFGGYGEGQSGHNLFWPFKTPKR